MKKRVLKFASLSTVVVIALSSCDKVNVQENNSLLSNQITTTPITTNINAAANPSNPMDAAGAELYLELSEINQTIDLINSDANDIITACNTWYKNKYPKATITINKVEDFELFIQSAGITDYDTYIETLNFSTEGKQTLKSIFSYLDNFNKSEFSEFKSGVVSLESSILSSQTLSSVDKNRILWLTATLRYSEYFWSNNGGLTPMGKNWMQSVFRTFYNALTYDDIDLSAMGNLAGQLAGNAIKRK